MSEINGADVPAQAFDNGDGMQSQEGYGGYIVGVDRLSERLIISFLSSREGEEADKALFDASAGAADSRA